MKRILLLVAMMSLVAIASIYAQSPVQGDEIELSLVPTGPEGGGGNSHGGGNSRPRGPVLMPEVSIDLYTLYFYSIGFDFTLQLIDEDDNVVYSTYVFIGTPSIILPSYLQGEYELRLVTDDYYYYAYITL